MEGKVVERTQAKKRVTRAVNKLKSSLQYQQVEDQKKLANKVEEEYEQLVEINEECIELGVKDDYMQEVEKSFISIMKSFQNSLKADEEINAIKHIETVLVDVQPWFERMGRVGPKASENARISELQELQEGMASCDKQLRDARSKLGSAGDKTLRTKMEDAMAKTTMYCLD